MELIMKLLNEVSNLAEQKKLQKGVYTEVVKALDARTDMMLEQLEYVPNKDGVQLFRETDEERLEIAKKDQAAIASDVCRMVPYGVTAICRAIYREVKEDLMAFATDFELSQNLSFTISFSSFCVSFGDSPSEKERDQQRLHRMLDQGYIIPSEGRHGNYILSDCDANTARLKDYCKQKFGARHIEFTACNNQIWKVKVHADLAAYQYPEPKPEPEKQPSEVLSADDLHELKKICMDYRGAIASYSSMAQFGSGNLVLGVIEGYMYHIEQLTSVHGSIWERKEAKHAGPRAINRQIQAINGDIGNQAALILKVNAKVIYEALWKRVKVLIEPLGFYLDKFTIGENSVMNIDLIQNSLRYKKGSLDADVDERNMCIYVKDTEENIETINRHVRSVLTSSEVYSYEVGIRNGVRYIKKLTIMFYKASDLTGLMEKVSIENQEEDI